MTDKDRTGGQETEKGFLSKMATAFSASKEFSLESLALAQKKGGELQGPLNGIFGDRLEELASPLAIPMRLYRYTADGFEPLEMDPAVLKESLAGEGDRICVFVHGLASSERTWLLRRKIPGPVSYAELLKRDTGHSCYFVRYNTGRHISANGRALAELLSQFVKAYPHNVREINLIGHSMGGLVSRSAAFYGEKFWGGWVKKLKRTFLLGSPLLGAHQEQIGKLTTDILGSIPNMATRITAKFFDLRSAGIQDLGYGYLRDEDWQPKKKSADEPKLATTNRRNPVPLVKHTRYYIIVGSLSKDPDSILSGFLGDGIVNRQSARGAADTEHYESYDGSHKCEIPGLNHTAIPGDPRVYRQLRAWLRADS